MVAGCPGIVEFGETTPELFCGKGSLGLCTSGMGAKKSAIAANAKLDKPKAAGAACFTKSSSDLAKRFSAGANFNPKLGKVWLSAKN